ncbi:MAG: Maf family protein, partial [Gammaproteobacteria bacterium]|nr:Maf family protein [Gammaproteobacteria bacterium]
MGSCASCSPNRSIAPGRYCRGIRITVSKNASVRDRKFVYLASASPRRAELLSQLGVTFAVTPAAIDETPQNGEAPDAYVERVAREKVHAARAALQDRDAPVLAADTAVVVADRILGKPIDEADAARMLSSLSGRSHEVLTAVAALDGDREDVVLSRTTVVFRPLDPDEFAAYWKTGEP